MHCHDIVDQIIAQSGRTALTPEIESHLAGCQTCSEVYFEQQALWRHMDAWEVPEVSAGFDRRLFARIGQRPNSTPHFLQPGLRHHLLFAVAAMVHYLDAPVLARLLIQALLRSLAAMISQRV